SGKAFIARLFGQVTDIVLERVWHPGVEHPHPTLAHVLLVLIAHQLREDVIVILVVAEHDVAADVPCESFAVLKAARQAANVRRALKNSEVLISEFFQSVAGAQSRGPRSDDDNLSFHDLLALN